MKLAWRRGSHARPRVGWEADVNKKLVAILSKASAAAAERFAQTDPTPAVTAATWDRDAFAIGTPESTLDPRAGQLRPRLGGLHQQSKPL